MDHSRDQSGTQPSMEPEARFLLSTKIEGTTMSSKPNKHELKTQETRSLLLRAAEEIFARDGYEKAELGEIARLAGRTKGAIYAQFKSKEDMFLALFEENALRRRAIMAEFLAKSDSIAGNVAAFRKYFIEFATNDRWSFLMLDFRLYAVRNPKSRERLHKVYQSILPPQEEMAYSSLLGPATKGKRAISRTEAVHTAFAMLTALRLEAQFDPEVVTSDVLKKVAGKLFDTMFGTNPPTQ
jgi:AcrR family transcriptional regulator